MKTSKVKAIQSVKPYNGQHGVTYYHNIELENGDKINIGKKKELQVGYEVTYEIIGDPGQHEYTKAKAVKPEQNNFKPKFDTKGIEVGHAINNAVNLVCAGVVLNIEYDSEEEKIYKYAQTIYKISQRLKNEL